MKNSKNSLSASEALDKIKNWCAYQERCQEEVRQKLFTLGIIALDADQIISTLIEEGFLNEERFARSYVRGKFKIKNWGRLKIKSGLKIKKIPIDLINLAMQEIEEETYYETMKKVLELKLKKTKEKNPVKRNFQLINYAYGKGFEHDLITEVLKDLKEI